MGYALNSKLPRRVGESARDYFVANGSAPGLPRAYPRRPEESRPKSRFSQEPAKSSHDGHEGRTMAASTEIGGTPGLMLSKIGKTKGTRAKARVPCLHSKGAVLVYAREEDSQAILAHIKVAV